MIKQKIKIVILILVLIILTGCSQEIKNLPEFNNQLFLSCVEGKYLPTEQMIEKANFRDEKLITLYMYPEGDYCKIESKFKKNYKTLNNLNFGKLNLNCIDDFVKEELTPEKINNSLIHENTQKILLKALEDVKEPLYIIDSKIKNTICGKVGMYGKGYRYSYQEVYYATKEMIFCDESVDVMIELCS